MGYIRSFLYEFGNTYTDEDRLITLLFASIFMPYIISAVVMLGATVYILWKNDIKELLARVKGAKLLMAFGGYLFVVSLLYQNWLGALLSVGMLALFVDVIYYRRYINKDVFEQAIDIAIILSVAAVVYAIGEQLFYMSQIDGMGFLEIQNKPQFRVHTFYFNANYYAMMILFVECMCIYKFFLIKHLEFRVYYTCVGILNLFALYLTGGRIAWLCLACAVLAMLLLNRWYKLFGGAIVGIAGCVGLLALKPKLLPRLASQGLKIGRRTKIWETAWLIIEDSWLTGRGPLTYYASYQSYTNKYITTYGKASLEQYKLGIASQHAHTMFLEPLVSFGVIGSILLFVYLWMQCHRVVHLFTKHKDYALGALIVGVIVVTITFCIIDFPVFWIQTGAFVLLMLGSADMFHKEVRV